MSLNLFNITEIPDGWRLVTLPELGNLDRGRSRHRPRHAPHLYGGPYPFIQTGDITNSGGRITAHSQSYSEAGLAQSRLWPKDTICITIAANIAETAILTYDACFPDSVVGFIGDCKKCDVWFVSFMFRYLRNLIQHQVEGTGSVQDNINLGILNSLRFPLPPLAEQRAIAYILKVLDDKIDLNRRMNQTLETMGASIFSHHFPHDPEDELPSGWKAKPIYDLANYYNGEAFKERHFDRDGNGLPIIKIAELKRGITDQTQFTSGEHDAIHRLADGDILFSWSGSPDTSIDTFLWAGGAAWLNQHIFKVVPYRDEERAFIYFLFRSLHDVFVEIARNKQTTGLGHVTIRDMREMLIAFPPEPVLAEFNQAASRLLRQIQHNLIESRTLVSLRDTLLPKLLSGEIRVKELEKQIEAVA